MASLQIRNLTKRHGSDTIVRGVHLDVADGEFLVIVGPSGCGKTSVLRMIAGLDEPSAGEVRIDGRALTDTGPGAWPVAMMFQEAALYPHLRVGENIGFPLRMAGERSSTIRREVTAIAARLGIRPLLGRRPGQLSGGQRQRVAMARSLIRKPEILLMDEPMSNLDAKLRGELRAAIAHLQHDLRITTVYVTHDQTEAMSLGDRIAVMRSGEIVQLDTPERVYTQPADAFVAGFVGSPTINLFAGRMGGDPADHLTVTLGSSPVPIAPEHRHDLAAWVGRDVVVGVRPHAFRFVDHGAVVDVERIETIGDRRLVDARLPAPIARVTTGGIAFDHGPTPIVVEAGAGDPVGEARWRASHVTVDPTDIHLFDPVSGRSLLATGTRAARADQPIRVAT